MELDYILAPADILLVTNWSSVLLASLRHSEKILKTLLNINPKLVGFGVSTCWLASAIVFLLFPTGVEAI